MIIGTYLLDGKEYTAFGIKCGDVQIEDISLNRRAVEHLVSLCNRESLSVIHLEEVVADFLEEEHWTPQQSVA